MKQDSKPVMSNTVDKHTPGQWEAKKITSNQIIIGIKGYGEGDNYRRDNQCGQIAQIHGWDGDKTAKLSEEDFANAALIASAPTLKKENEELKERNRVLVEALERIKAIYDNKEDAAGVIAKEALQSNQ